MSIYDRATGELLAHPVKTYSVYEIHDDPPPAFWTVAIYLIDRAYGGPEECGWWFDTGKRIDHHLEGMNPNDVATIFIGPDAEKEAYAYAGSLNDYAMPALNHGRREIGSVLSEGRYQAQAHPLYPPAFYPETKPHYE